MKILNFYFRGDHYQVDSSGRIKANGLTTFSDQWRFLGGSKHHWHNRITVTIEQAFEDPSLLNGCLGWDVDHGTTRQWLGRFNGKLPRIQSAHVTRSETNEHTKQFKP